MSKITASTIASAILLVGHPSGAMADGAIGEIKICKLNSPEEYEKEDGKSWWRKKMFIPAGTIFYDDGPVGTDGPSLKFRVTTMRDVILEGSTKCAASRAVVSNKGAYYVGNEIGDPVSKLSPSDNRHLVRDSSSAENLAKAEKYGWFDLVHIDATVSKAFK